jgi:mono/diheme cytochrome c family protein
MENGRFWTMPVSDLDVISFGLGSCYPEGYKGEMPPFAKKYNEQDAAFIVAYLKTLR